MTNDVTVSGQFDGVTDSQLIQMQIAEMTPKGWQIVSQSESSIQIRKPRQWSKLLLILGLVGLLFYGAGIIFLILAVFDFLLKKDRVMFITADQIRNCTVPKWSDSKMVLYLSFALLFVCVILYVVSQGM